jgi:hypothetical protein
MTLHLAAGAANCHAGSWLQQWKCGWNQPTTAASHAGLDLGHNAPLALIIAAVVLLAVRMARKRRASRRPSAGGTARAGARRS